MGKEKEEDDVLNYFMKKRELQNKVLEKILIDSHNIKNNETKNNKSSIININ